MTFGGAIRSCFSKYATFSGRAPRSEYWYFTLFFYLIYFAYFALDAIASQMPEVPARIIFAGAISLIFIIALLASILPHISVMVRRLHDTDRSGWWYWIALVPLVGAILLLVWFCTKGTEGPNRYGTDPFDKAHVFS
jgi:uncharacterized membrane protein YhaH (DUF805 family)